MATYLKERTQQLNELTEFISLAKNKIQLLVNQLGWDEEHLQKEEKNMVSCPLNSEHRIPQENLQNHINSCSWRMEGYHQLDVSLPENWVSGANNITIGKELRNVLLQEAAAKNPSMKLGFTGVDTRPLPKTADRLVADFTSDERLAMYDYALSKMGVVSDSKTDLPLEFQKDDDKSQRPKTFLERLAEERDAKRRRVSYRNKKVHTNKKSQTEIIREVIQNQMDLYEEWLKQEKDTLNPETSEYYADTVQHAFQAQEKSSSSTKVECSADYREQSSETRKIPFQYIARMRRKKGNPYAVAREISNYMEDLSQMEKNYDEYKAKDLNEVDIQVKHRGRNTDRYLDEGSSVKDENDRHRRSRPYEYERSHKSEVYRMYDSHCYSGRRNSSSPESERHRQKGAEKHKKGTYSAKNSNVDGENWRKYNKKDRSYSPKREYQRKYESESKRYRHSNFEASRTDYYHRSQHEHEKKNENLELRKQKGNSENSEFGNHGVYSEPNLASEEKQAYVNSRGYRKEQYYASTSDKKHHVSSKSSEHTKHGRHKHHISYRDKYKGNDSSESSKVGSNKYSASEVSLSEESDTNKKGEGSLEYYANEENVFKNKEKSKHKHIDHTESHKHKHKKKHKKKMKHVKRERKPESENSSSDFSC